VLSEYTGVLRDTLDAEYTEELSLDETTTDELLRTTELEGAADEEAEVTP
jgi:hypothetical protein